MRAKLRSKVTLLFMTFGLLLAIPAVALADEIKDGLDTAANQTQTITAGDSTSTGFTNEYWIVANAASVDGVKSPTGCDVGIVNDNVTATFQVNVPDGVTASASSLTFDECKDGSDLNSQTVKFTSNTPGTYTIPALTKTAGTGVYTTSGTAFTLVVNDNCPGPGGDTSGNLQDGKCTSNTAPDVSVSNVTNGASYEFGSVPAASCSVTDAEDTNESATPVFDKSGLNSYGLGTVKVKCSYTDGGGLSDSEEVSYTIKDTGKPAITDQGPTAAANSFGWYTSAVTNTFKAQDYDANGNTGAGFAGETNPYTFTKSSGTAEGSAVKIASGTVTDVANNTGDSIDSAAFKIDLSDPYNVAFVGGPATGSSHYFGSVPAAPTCTGEDDVSGLKDCKVTGYSSAVGTHTLTATATDNAGRTATATRSYTVDPWTFKGFYQPVDMNNVLNTVKGGSTVPLKFELFAGSTELTDTANVVTPLKATKVACDTGLSLDEIEMVASGSTALRYDGTAGQYIYNWKTPTGAGTCYNVTIAANDGSSQTAKFKLK